MARHTLVADDAILRVLRAATIDDAGLTLAGQLSREDYLAVNKFLSVAGATWNRKANRHLFSDSRAAEKIRTLLGDGKLVDEKKLYNFFPTPPDVARQMATLCGILAGKRVLEPSAGSGNIVRAIFNNATGAECVRVVAVEIDPVRFAELEAQRLKTVYAKEENFAIHQKDFLLCETADLGLFDAIIMNPPFENGGRNADIKHIRHALQFRKTGGMLVAICANGPRQNEELRPSADFWEELPAGTFKESGTGVNAVLMAIY